MEERNNRFFDKCTNTFYDNLTKEEYKTLQCVTTSCKGGDVVTTDSSDTAVPYGIVQEKDAIISVQHRQISNLLKETADLTKKPEYLVLSSANNRHAA